MTNGKTTVSEEDLVINILTVTGNILLWKPEYRRNLPAEEHLPGGYIPDCSPEGPQLQPRRPAEPEPRAGTQLQPPSTCCRGQCDVSPRKPTTRLFFSCVQQYKRKNLGGGTATRRGVVSRGHRRRRAAWEFLLCVFWHFHRQKTLFCRIWMCRTV